MAGSGVQATSSLIGRERELGALTDLLETAWSGQLRVGLVAGEPGIGKTRLLDTMGTIAANRGATVLHGDAFEAEGMPPYLPFVEALGQHIRAAAPDELRKQTSTIAPILATILPELVTRCGEPAAVSIYPLPAEQARLRLYEAVGEFLARIATSHPVLFVLDDLQWADDASFDVLVYVARHQPDARLLVLAACRDANLAQPEGLARTIADLNRLRRLSTLALKRLDPRETAELARHYLEAAIGEIASRELFAQSEGNPFFAEELLRSWRETESLVKCSSEADDSRHVYDLRAPMRQRLPESIAGAIGQRLTRLDPDTVEILRAAAIIGRSFPVDLVAAVTGREPHDIDAKIHTAVVSRLIDVDESGVFTFSHDKVRETLAEQLTPFWRRRLHGLIAVALESDPTPIDSQRLAELVFHFSRSGDQRRAAHYARAAADHAMQTYAATEAIAYLQRVIEATGDGDEQRGALLARLGEASILAGAEQQAVEAFRSAQSWFQAQRRIVEAANAAWRRGQACWRQEAIPEARAAFEEALALLSEHGGPDLVRVQIDLASLLGVSLHQNSYAITLSQQALELAQPLGDDRLLASATRTLGNLLVRNNDPASGISLLEQSLSFAMAAGDPVEAAECCASLAPAHFWQGALRRCREVVQLRLEFAQRCHDTYQLRHVYTWLAVISGCQGKLEQAARELDQASAIVEHLASPEPIAYLLFCRGALAFFRGDIIAANAYLEDALARFREIGPGALVWYVGLQAIIFAAEHQVEQSIAYLEELEAMLSALPSNEPPPTEPIAALVEASLRLGDRERLDTYYPTLLATNSRFADFVVDRLLGEIETVRGDFSAAAVHLAAAEQLAREEEIVWELVRILEAQAMLSLVRDSRDGRKSAQERLTQALTTVRRIGNPGEASRLQERISSLEERPSHPAGLTPREVEILRLLTAGLSNRMIADELALSEKTIESHLTSIYGKTGADNRAAAAAFAIRFQLA